MVIGSTLHLPFALCLIQSTNSLLTITIAFEDRVKSILSSLHCPASVDQFSLFYHATVTSIACWCKASVHKDNWLNWMQQRGKKTDSLKKVLNDDRILIVQLCLFLNLVFLVKNSLKSHFCLIVDLK